MSSATDFREGKTPSLFANLQNSAAPTPAAGTATASSPAPAPGTLSGTSPGVARGTLPEVAPEIQFSDVLLPGDANSFPPSSDIVLEATGLVKTYGHGEGAVRALNHIDLSIARGQFTAIMGPSGSGKSTLMHCLAGLDTITSGSVVLDGHHLGEMSERQLTRLRREKIGFIFQSFNLVPTLSARENIMLPMDIAKRKVSADHFHQVVSAVGLGDRLTHYPAELSGGQQQRVACARALVGSPAVVFADEPTGNLDSQATAQVLRFLRKAVDEFQQTVVMVTHEADAAAWADRVVFIQDGAIAMELQQPTRDSVLEALRELGNMDEVDAAESTGIAWCTGEQPIVDLEQGAEPGTEPEFESASGLGLHQGLSQEAGQAPAEESRQRRGILRRSSKNRETLGTGGGVAGASPELSNIDANVNPSAAAAEPAGAATSGAIPLSGAIPGVTNGVTGGLVDGVSVSTGGEAVPTAGMAPGMGIESAPEMGTEPATGMSVGSGVGANTGMPTGIPGGLTAGMAMGAHPITGEVPQVEDDAFVSVNFAEEPLAPATGGVDYTQLTQMPLGELPNQLLNQGHTPLTTPTTPALLTAPTDASMEIPVSTGIPTAAESDPFSDMSGTAFTGAGSMMGVPGTSGTPGTSGAARPDGMTRTGAIPRLGETEGAAATTGMTGATSTGLPEEMTAPTSAAIQPDLNMSGMSQAGAVFVDPVEPQTQIIDLNVAGDQLWQEIPMDSRERASARGAHYAAAHAYPNDPADYLAEQFLPTISGAIPVGEAQPEQISEGQRQMIVRAQEILEHLPGSVMEQNQRNNQ